MASNTDQQSTINAEPLLLPPTTQGSSGSATQITVGGAVVSLADELGPMVVNSNGTLSRIANWPNMTREERERTLRVLGKRNQLRLANEEQKLHKEGDNISQ